MEQKKPMGIYIHIPFCNRKCDYCDFVSYSMDRRAQQLYLEALFTEIDQLSQKYQEATFDTIFIGGGTPSIVYEGFIASLARKLYSSFHFSKKIEFTIEVNPASFTREKFFEYAEAGVNRISVGVQCLDEKLLHDNGRIQSVENVVETFKILSDSQFSNVNGDVMIGLPGQTADSILDTIKFLLKHHVKHISVYSLQIEKHTLLYDKLRRGKITPMGEKETIDIYNKVYKQLKKQGFKRYEVSNYCRPGFECNHNMKYWENVDYVGLGVSAHSYVGGYRYFNTKRLDTYIDSLNSGKPVVYKKEYVTNAERRTERIMLSLRTSKGLDLEAFEREFNEDLLKSKADRIKSLMEHNMIKIEEGFLKIAEDYFYVSNSIIVELI